jgi:hypothetical protein
MAQRRILGTAFGGVCIAALTLAGASSASAETPVAEPATFTSAFTVMATPDQVIDTNGVAAPGEPGAAGTFNFRINSDLEIICYDITLTGVTGAYQSPAKTATHIHEAATGASGPPRIAFPDPVDDGTGTRTSSGCLQGPFTTGVTPNGGADTGTGFTLAQIEANPAGFTADTHTDAFTAGAVRGQLQRVPIGGIDTGIAPTQGGIAPEVVIGAGAAGALAVGVLATVLYRRRTSPQGS